MGRGGHAGKRHVNLGFAGETVKAHLKDIFARRAVDEEKCAVDLSGGALRQSLTRKAYSLGSAAA